MNVAHCATGSQIKSTQLARTVLASIVLASILYFETSLILSISDPSLHSSGLFPGEILLKLV